ncbi:hypothetical protein A1O1_07284 [Capronia coronata CBS 617.96]|uniref:Ubiquilin n=1 Tax=Capronia coronata CBS 617.96 TaxID=1182541 RepID=W9Y1Z2_9EURO|nr:uncharacterized protein A1O1_07284 [Capronia coronata CBS 617.96]EXJ83660.1 hypothetical protein A1O1_07284 [Capronia coronata CBS 617.96]
MADASGTEDATVTFHVKSSGGQKYTLTLPLSTTTIDLKNKLASEEYANVPASAQRLIYSGKVLKDNETLAQHNVKEGNTMHLVKSAASNQRQNPAAQSSTSTSSPGAAPQVAGVPQNLASGTGNDPLAGLTGARYAGFAQLPNASMFQTPQSPDDFVRQLEDPNFQQMMREAMNNPQIVDMMINQSPQLRAMGPQARQLLQSDYFRRVMTDPQAIRSVIQMQSAMGMGPFGGGGQEAFPAPGVVNTTDTPNAGGDANTQAGQQQQQPPPNPFAALGGGGGLGANPFGSLFMPPFPMPNQATTSPGSQNNTAAQNDGADSATQGQQQQQPPNPFAALFNPAMFGQPQAGAGAGTGAPPPVNPFAPQNNPFLQNPEAMAQFMQAMGGMGGGLGGGAGNMGGAGTEGANYGGLFDLLGAARPTSPPDNRPPEERYATQLQQLNDMGFYDFDRNIQALRRTGGSVNGAIEYLLSNP